MLFMISDNLDDWKIFQNLSDELKQNIRLAIEFSDGAIYVKNDDDVFGFGINLRGFLGSGDKEPHTEHTKIVNLCGQNVVGLPFSPRKCFAVCASGSVFAWGMNECGQLGLGTKQRTFFPTKIEGMLATKKVVQVACGDLHTLALTSDREVFTFGLNNEGQLGLGHKEDQSLPVKLEFPVAGRVVTAIACLNTSSLALLDSGEVFSWGSNTFGILGHSSDNLREQNIPRLVPGLEGITITKIACGMHHALALSSDGKVYSWGWNLNGQLGNGTDENSHQPTLISGSFGRIIDVAAYYTCGLSAAVTEADQVYIWGSFNGYNILIPRETSFKSLNELSANLPIPDLTFRLFQPKQLDEPAEENDPENELPTETFDDADTADFVFVVEGQKIHVHKTVLITRCPVFEAMFQGTSWKESNQREQNIEQYSFKVFYAFLRYFYTNEVDPQTDFALDLFAVAHYYRMNDLQEVCLRTIKRGVTVENAAMIYDSAIYFDAVKLQEFVFDYCKGHMTAFVKSDGFKQLNSDLAKDLIIRASQEGAFKN